MAAVLLGTHKLSIRFPSSSHTTRNGISTLPPPPEGSEVALAFMISFAASYDDHDEYGFGQFGASVEATSLTQLSAAMSLRDNHVNERVWSGQIDAMVMYFGAPAG